MKILKPIIDYCDKNDIKLIESTWLLYCHTLGAIGIIWAFFLEKEMFYKYLLVRKFYLLFFRLSLYGTQ